jgi:hypothetical protein
MGEAIDRSRSIPSLRYRSIVTTVEASCCDEREGGPGTEAKT